MSLGNESAVLVRTGKQYRQAQDRKNTLQRFAEEFPFTIINPYQCNQLQKIVQTVILKMTKIFFAKFISRYYYNSKF